MVDHVIPWPSDGGCYSFFFDFNGLSIKINKTVSLFFSFHCVNTIFINVGFKNSIIIVFLFNDYVKTWFQIVLEIRLLYYPN